MMADEESQFDKISSRINGLVELSRNRMGELSENILTLNKLITAITALLVIFGVLLVMSLYIVVRLVRRLTSLRADMELIDIIPPANRTRRQEAPRRL